MTDKKVLHDDGTEAFDEKNVIVLKGFAEFVQALVTIGDALKALKPIITYIAALFTIWLLFNNEVLAWLKDLVS